MKPARRERPPLPCAEAVSSIKAWAMMDRLGFPSSAVSLNSSLGAILPRRWFAWDALLAALVGAAATLQIISHVRDADPQLPLYVVFSAALVLSLTFRRLSPLGIYALIVTVASVQLASGIALAADLVVLIGLYTVAVNFPFRVAMLAAGVAELGAWVAAWRLPYPLQLGDTIVVLSTFVLVATMTGAYIQVKSFWVVYLIRDPSGVLGVMR